MEQENGVEVELDTQETTEQDEATENASQDEEEDTTSWQKNKSNWKKMAETKKALEKDLKEAREELIRVKEWANSLYENEEEKPFNKKEEVISEDKISKLEKKIFLSDNKEAKEYLEDIEAVQAKYWMDLEDAWAFVKAKLPPESKTKKDFDLGQKSAPVKKKLADISPEEALKLPREQQREWRKLQGWE